MTLESCGTVRVTKRYSDSRLVELDLDLEIVDFVLDVTVSDLIQVRLQFKIKNNNNEFVMCICAKYAT